MTDPHPANKGGSGEESQVPDAVRDRHPDPGHFLDPGAPVPGGGDGRDRPVRSNVAALSASVPTGSRAFPGRGTGIVDRPAGRVQPPACQPSIVGQPSRRSTDGSAVFMMSRMVLSSSATAEPSRAARWGSTVKYEAALFNSRPHANT